MSTVRAAFKPEFLNRLDEVVIFDALTQAELTHIVDLQVRQLATRLHDRRITPRRHRRGEGVAGADRLRPGLAPVRCADWCRRRSGTGSPGRVSGQVRDGDTR